MARLKDVEWGSEEIRLLSIEILRERIGGLRFGEEASEADFELWMDLAHIAKMECVAPLEMSDVDWAEANIRAGYPTPPTYMLGGRTMST